MDPRFENRCRLELCRTDSHIYLLPHPALRPLVAHYTLCPAWGGFLSDGAGTLTLIPDASGCFVLSLSESAPHAWVYGPSSVTATVTGGGGPAPPRLFVEFRPGGLFAFTGVPQAELRDKVWDLAAVAPALFQLYLRLLYTAPDLDAFILRLDAALCATVQTPAPIRPMLDYLAASRERSPVQALARETGYSPRHLARLFREGAGMGCKSFLRVLRVNDAVGRIQAGAPLLTILAQELGYFDQAHFIHDFRAVCGVSPGEYRQSLSDFYNEPLKF